VGDIYFSGFHVRQIVYPYWNKRGFCVVAQWAGVSVVTALVGIEDDAEWKFGTDEYCYWAAMVDVVMSRGSVEL
jgi:hypothetical protein